MIFNPKGIGILGAAAAIIIYTLVWLNLPRSDQHMRIANRVIVAALILGIAREIGS